MHRAFLALFFPLNGLSGRLSVPGAPVVGPLPGLGGASIGGVWEPGLAAFRGIPFAQPPVDSLRWMPSKPYVASANTSLFNASVNGPACYQHGAAKGSSSSESEDCLYLNVFVPKEHLANASSLPVMFWIHGGMNMEGSAASYGPIEHLATAGPMVLVVPQYRLNIFGFLALKELSALDPRGVSGNAGITDLQLALHWVQNNIDAFGGNKNLVTVMGQSSGGTNVLALLAGQSNKALFHRAVSLSASPNISMDQGSKERQDRVIIEKSPCAGKEDNQLLQCLYGLSSSQLYNAMPESYGFFYQLYDYPVDHSGLGVHTGTAGKPVGVSGLIQVDGVTVSHTLDTALGEGLNDVPLLLQTMQTEMSCYLTQQLVHIDEKGLRSFFDSKFSSAYGSSMGSQVFDVYSNISREFSPEYAAYAVDADTASACGLQSLSRLAAAGFSSPVYWGTVTAGASGAVDGQRLAFHNWDLQAAIQAWDGNPTLGVPGNPTLPVYSDYRPSQRDQAFGERVLRHLLSFAIDGRLDSSEWLPVKPEEALVVSSVVGPLATVPVAGLKSRICHFWTSNGVGKNWWWIN